MKKLLLTGLLFTSCLNINAQLDWNTLGNTPVPGNFLGTLNTESLRIRTNNIERMKITDGGTGVNFGRIAMGNNLPNNFAPLSRLHLHQDAGVNTIRFTTGNMGGVNGFQVGYDASGNAPNRRYAQLLNHENTAMKFFTNAAQRMHINPDNQSNINGYTVSTSGYGQLKVYAANLSQGIYQYSILVDGKVIETKKMVVEK